MLDEIYLTLEIGIWLNDSFVLLVDNIPDIATSVSLKQAVNLKYHRVSSHHQKRNDYERELVIRRYLCSYLIVETNLNNSIALYHGYFG